MRRPRLTRADRVLGAGLATAYVIVVVFAAVRALS